MCFILIVLAIFSGTLKAQNILSLSVADSIQNAIDDSIAAQDDTLFFAHQLVIPLDSLINYSRKFVGLPYKFGGRTEKGFDCSGFVAHVFRNFGVELPPSSRSQVNVGIPVTNDSIRKGDLLFFKGRNVKSSSIGHVALVIDVSDTNGVQMIHSTRHGLKIDWLSEEQYFKKRFVTTRRLPIELQ